MIQTLTEENAIRNAFAYFLAQHGINDDAVLGYIVCTAASEHVEVHGLDELLCGFSPDVWGAQSVDARLQKLNDVQHQVAQCRGTSIDADSPAMQPASAGAARQQASAKALEQPAPAAPSPRAAPFTEEKDDAAAAIDGFLARGGPALSDPAVAEYVHGLLADREAFSESAGAGAVESLDDVLCGFDADCWGGEPEAARHSKLCDLLAELSELQRAGEQHSQPQRPPPHSRSQLSAVPQPAADRQGGGAEPAAELAPADSNASPEADPVAVVALQELCCGAASIEYLTHVLMRQCHGNLEAAAAAVLDCPDLARREAAWRAAAAAAESAAARDAVAQKAERQRLFARFALQAVPCGGNSGGGGGRGGVKKGQAAVDAWQPPNGAQSTSKVRFREGRPVTNRGEKYIVEDPREEYDGGSRGKVKTKGKRGVGYA